MTCLQRVSNLLGDDMYFARRQGVQIATRLYHKWARPQVQFHLEVVTRQARHLCFLPL